MTVFALFAVFLVAVSQAHEDEPATIAKKQISISIATKHDEARPYEATFDASDAADPWRLGGAGPMMDYKLFTKKQREKQLELEQQQQQQQQPLETGAAEGQAHAEHALQAPQAGAWRYFEFYIDKDGAHLAVQLSELRLYGEDAASNSPAFVLKRAPAEGEPAPAEKEKPEPQFDAEGNEIAPPVEYLCTFENPKGENPAGEEVDKLFDNDTQTKWVDVKFTENEGTLVRIACPNSPPLPLRSYEIFTANDERVRDPSRWTLKGSVDNVTFQLLDERANLHTPLSRLASYGRFDLLHTGSNEAAHTHADHHGDVPALRGHGTAESALRAFRSARVISELMPETVMHLVHHVGAPFAIFLLCNCDRDAYFGNVLADIEDDIIDQRLNEHMTFLFLEQPLAQRFGLFAVFDVTTDQLPVMVIDNIPMGSNNEKFKLQIDFSPGEENIVPDPHVVTQFISDFRESKLPLIVRSQTPPLNAATALQPGSGMVAEVVGATFSEIVLDPGRAVFLLVYAPWCGGSRAVAPLFDQVARLLRDDPEVLVARMDKTVNDFTVRGIRVTHYPTVLLFPMGVDKQAIDFEDFNGSKEAHNKLVPHTHYSAEIMTNFVLSHKRGMTAEEAATLKARAEAMARAGHAGHGHGHGHGHSH